jgi:coenzyme PQQ synthesis protein D (PqqD)
MSTNTQSAGTPSETSAKGMRPEIATKWGKFSTQEIADLKDKDDLVAQVQTKYGIDKAQAQRDVDAFAKGRAL